MLASVPASMLNQIPADSGIPRFCQISSRSKWKSNRPWSFTTLGIVPEVAVVTARVSIGIIWRRSIRDWEHPRHWEFLVARFKWATSTRVEASRMRVVIAD